jgi:hypothetical protein
MKVIKNKAVYETSYLKVFDFINVCINYNSKSINNEATGASKVIDIARLAV